jgi:hypothetical protein
MELNKETCFKLLIQYLELAQGKGSFLLSEAALLKRAIDVAKGDGNDSEINMTNAKNLLISGIHKGQKSGAYTLNDAALLDKVVQIYSAETVEPVKGSPSTPQVPTPQVPTQSVNVQPVEQEGSVPIHSGDASTTSVDSGDLSDLSAPVPLKPREI